MPPNSNLTRPALCCCWCRNFVISFSQERNKLLGAARRRFELESRSKRDSCLLFVTNSLCDCDDANENDKSLNRSPNGARRKEGRAQFHYLPLPKSWNFPGENKNTGGGNKIGEERAATVPRGGWVGVCAFCPFVPLSTGWPNLTERRAGRLINCSLSWITRLRM